MASRQSVLNLASKPFANRRPIKRAGFALWSIAVVLSVINGLLFWSYLSGSSEGREALESVRNDIETEGTTLRELSDELKAFDLQAMNPKADYLNERIAERTFPWSRLFDDLVEAMPIQVRLSSLSPRPPDQRQRRRDSEAPDWIELEIRGYAANGEALLNMVDALFEHPGFAAPTLLNERRNDAGETSFTMTARYRSKSTADEAITTSMPSAFDALNEPDAVAGEGPSPTASPTEAVAPPETAVTETARTDGRATNRSPRAEPLRSATAGGVDRGDSDGEAAPAPVEFSLPSASAPAGQGGRP